MYKRQSQIYFDDIYYYIKPTEGQVDAWEELPDSVKETYEKLGIPEAERKYLAGVTAQYESEVVYHRNREDLEAQGVIFSDMDSPGRYWLVTKNPSFKESPSRGYSGRFRRKMQCTLNASRYHR